MADKEEQVKEFRERYKVGFCLKPKGMSRMPFLAPSKQFLVPKQIDCRDLMTPCENQGNKPWCAAYAAANWAEAMQWRVNDTFEQIKPDWIYAYAKEHDGMPNCDGTTLNAVLEALRGSVFDRDVCKVKIVRPNRLSVKYALHKFGAILGGFNVTEEWYGCTDANPVIKGTSNVILGGHAIIICGYDREGVWIYNSWSAQWGHFGTAKVLWEEVDRAMVYGAVLSNVLDGLTINT